MTRLDHFLGQLADREPGACQFTLHVAFLAKDEEQAGFRAALYVQALNTLRAEVECFGASVSADSDWSAAVPVYCNAPGPDPMDVCLERFGHEDRHRGPGGSGTWTDDEVPAAPDNPGSVSSGGPAGPAGIVGEMNACTPLGVHASDHRPGIGA